jgi:hypothetical protein
LKTDALEDADFSNGNNRSGTLGFRDRIGKLNSSSQPRDYRKIRRFIFFLIFVRPRNLRTAFT